MNNSKQPISDRLEATRLGVSSGQRNLRGTREEAKAELKTAEVKAFYLACGQLIINTALAAAHRDIDKRLYAHLQRELQLSYLSEACIHHSTEATRLNANPLSYAEAMLKCRSDIMAVAYSRGVLSMAQYATLAELNSVVGSKEYKDIVLAASTECQTHFCILYEAMMCCTTAIIMQVPSPVAWPVVTAEMYTAQQFSVDPDYQGWL